MPACWTQANGAIRIVQSDFTPDRLAAEISVACRRAAAVDHHGDARRVRSARWTPPQRLADLVMKAAGP